MMGRALLGLLPALVLAACSTTSSPPATSSATGAVEHPRPIQVPKLPAGVQLVGLGSGDLQSLLGQPTLVRSEQQAQYWRYSLGGCQLDVFLYTEPGSGTTRVVYLDVRPSGYATLAHAGACEDIGELLRGEAAMTADRREPDTTGLPAVESY
jgi:hypothetical protein